MIYSDLTKDIENLLESHGTPKREVYLDSENSGLIFPEALDAMVKAYAVSGRGHPSITHRAGWESYELMFKSSVVVAEAINCKPDEIVYTHSGTEANNLAITGIAQASKKRKKIILSNIEHLSVVFPSERLQELGFVVVKVPVDREGFIDLEFLANQIDKDTLLVSVAPVNHEVGVIQDARAMVEVVRDRDEEVKIHLDACDALCKIRFDVKDLGIDLASFSSHKVYGPKGVGALYVREGIELTPIIRGQLSTQKLWAGLENIPGIAGFAKAVDLMHRNYGDYTSRMAGLRDKLIDEILGSIDHTLLNGPRGFKRSPDNVNISFLYCEGEALTLEMSLKGVYVSSGSACTSRILEPSHVLLALGRKYEEAHGSILMKTTPFHSESDIDYVVHCFPEAVKRIRSINPFKPGGK